MVETSDKTPEASGRVGRDRLTAVYERDGDGFWLVELVEEPRVHSYGRTLAKAKAHIRDAAGLWYQTDPDGLEIVDDVRLARPVCAAVDRALRARARADQANRAAAAETQAAARALVGHAGLSVRDAGELLGVSFQRVHQLLERSPASTETAISA